MAHSFPLLFSPIRIGRIEIPNRICFSAHTTNFSTHGVINEQHIAYYEERAKGGCGLIILGELSIHPTDRPYEQMIEAYNLPIGARQRKCGIFFLPLIRFFSMSFNALFNNLAFRIRSSTLMIA